MATKFTTWYLKAEQDGNIDMMEREIALCHTMALRDDSIRVKRAQRRALFGPSFNFFENNVKVV